MAEKGKSVDEAIEEVAAEHETGMQGFKEALEKAHDAMERARETMKDAYGAARDRAHLAAEKSREYLADAKRHLGEASDAMGQLASKTRDQAEVLYKKAKEQYESLSARSRELYDKIKKKVAEMDLKDKGDQVLDYIRHNPGKSVLIALAVGFVVGYATRPRD